MATRFTFDFTIEGRNGDNPDSAFTTIHQSAVTLTTKDAGGELPDRAQRALIREAAYVAALYTEVEELGDDGPLAHAVAHSVVMGDMLRSIVVDTTRAEGCDDGAEWVVYQHKTVDDMAFVRLYSVTATARPVEVPA